MGDIQDLKDLVAQQVREAANAQKRCDDILAELARLCAAAPAAAAPAAAAAAAGPGHVHAADPDAAAAAALVARADKISKLGKALRKSS